MPASKRSTPTGSVGRPTAYLQPPLLIKGSVVNVDGKPIEGVRLDCNDEAIQERFATTGPRGEFRLTLKKEQFWLAVTATGSALLSRRFFLDLRKNDLALDRELPWVSVESTGLILHPLVMSPGAAVTGRVVREGMPVQGATIGLMQGQDSYTDIFPGELETKTDGRGTFRFPHVPPETNYSVYATLGSVADHGAVVPLSVHTTEDGSVVDLGELHVQRGRTLAGRVVCSDGKAPPAGTRIAASCPQVGGTVYAVLDEKQRFECHGIPDGAVYLHLLPPERTLQVGYRFSPANKCLNPSDPTRLEGRLEHDVTNLTILVEPGEPDKLAGFRDIDPTILADFDDAKAGPITGVPPQP